MLAVETICRKTEGSLCDYVLRVPLHKRLAQFIFSKTPSCIFGLAVRAHIVPLFLFAASPMSFEAPVVYRKSYQIPPRIRLPDKLEDNGSRMRDLISNNFLSVLPSEVLVQVLISSVDPILPRSPWWRMACFMLFGWVSIAFIQLFSELVAEYEDGDPTTTSDSTVATNAHAVAPVPDAAPSDESKTPTIPNPSIQRSPAIAVPEEDAEVSRRSLRCRELYRSFFMNVLACIPSMWFWAALSELINIVFPYEPGIRLMWKWFFTAVLFALFIVGSYMRVARQYTDEETAEIRRQKKQKLNTYTDESPPQ